MAIETAMYFYAWMGLIALATATLICTAVFTLESWHRLIVKWAEYSSLLYATVLLCGLRYHKAIDRENSRYAARMFKMRMDMLKAEDKTLWSEFMREIEIDDDETPLTERVLTEVFCFTFSDGVTAELIKTCWQESAIRFTLIAHVLEVNDNDELRVIMEIETQDIRRDERNQVSHEGKTWSAYLPMEYRTQEQLQQLIDGLSAGQKSK